MHVTGIGYTDVYRHSNALGISHLGHIVNPTFFPYEFCFWLILIKIYTRPGGVWIYKVPAFSYRGVGSMYKIIPADTECQVRIEDNSTVYTCVIIILFRYPDTSLCRTWKFLGTPVYIRRINIVKSRVLLREMYRFNNYREKKINIVWIAKPVINSPDQTQRPIKQN